MIVPNTGDLPGTWGSAAVNPDFVAIDGYLGGVQTVAVAGTSFTLTAPAGFTPTPGGGPTQAQNAVIKLTGALTTNVQITLPLPGITTIHNLSTNGAFAVFVAVAGGASVLGIPQGTVTRVYNDGTNIYYVDLPSVGSFLDLCTTTIPIWIADSSPAPYLYCNGATFSGTTYPYLNSFLGGTTLPDLRGRSRFYFNDGTGRITSGGSGINGDALGSGGGNELTQAHVHNVNGNTSNESATHFHTLNGGSPFTVGSSSVGSGPSGPGAAGPAAAISPSTGTESAAHFHSLNINTNTFGGGGSQNMPPAVISGMTFIRAG